MDRYLRLSLVFLCSFVFSIIMHNAIYFIFKIEEAVFFSLSIISAFLFVFAWIYTAVVFIRNKIRNIKKLKQLVKKKK